MIDEDDIKDAHLFPSNTILASLTVVYIKNRTDLSYPWSNSQGGATSNSVLTKLLESCDVKLYRLGGGE